MDDGSISNNFTILRSVVGSRLHGLNVEGQDDRDLMGVCIEPPEYVIGLAPFEHYTWRTRPEGVRSGPGDVDSVTYSLRKYMRLALNGNPTVLLPLFAPLDMLGVCDSFGAALREFAPNIVSRAAGKRFLGYMQAQCDRMLGLRGGHALPRRPELVGTYGYDTKYAMHMIRLAYQGIELLSQGRIILPMIPERRQYCMDVRLGKVTRGEALDRLNALEVVLRELCVSSDLPPEPDRARADRFLVDMYRDYWWVHGKQLAGAAI
jgi:hypothetical protein